MMVNRIAPALTKWMMSINKRQADAYQQRAQTRVTRNPTAPPSRGEGGASRPYRVYTMGNAVPARRATEFEDMAITEDMFDDWEER